MLFQHFKTALCMEEGEMPINQHYFAPSNHPKIPWLIGGVPQIDCAQCTCSLDRAHNFSKSHLKLQRWKLGNKLPRSNKVTTKPVFTLAGIAASKRRSVKQLVLRAFHPGNMHLRMSSFSQIKVATRSTPFIGIWIAPSSLFLCKRNQIYVFRAPSIVESKQDH